MNIVRSSANSYVYYNRDQYFPSEILAPYAKRYIKLLWSKQASALGVAKMAPSPQHVFFDPDMALEVAVHKETGLPDLVTYRVPWTQRSEVVLSLSVDWAMGFAVVKTMWLCSPGDNRVLHREPVRYAQAPNAARLPWSQKVRNAVGNSEPMQLNRIEFPQVAL